MTNSTFDISVHKNILFQILKDIYSDTTIAPLLGFKGGTAALMFFELNRFSVDLDFDLLDESKENYVFDRIEQIAKKYGSIKEMERKRFNLLFVLSYEDKARKIKIEINRRAFGSRYELKTNLGVSMLVMARDDMFAHKLMAMHERVGKTSRDVYDVWFFLEHRWPINKEIVEKRAGMTFPELMQKCIEQLEKMNNRNILDGLGDLLTEPQKDWARAKLRTEAIFLLKARLESEK
ncbi:MAG: nucleotidyl transferase AbiEii/AbiGii toxin family protein [Candidatus Colwellbacteria bacterium]|nr:nucleotidyl transferase AbiEii/AbiGii toxin family protein [Candidatus Colwellbacteria bacterium]